MVFNEQNPKDSATVSPFEETLDLLEWPRLCEQISSFSCTPQGKKRCMRLPIPNSITTTKSYLAETLEIGTLDKFLENGLSFVGIHDLDNILHRSAKGGVLSGEELLAIAETLRSARRLRRQIYDQELRPTLSSLLSDIATLPELQKLLEFGLEEGGRIADRASERLSQLRRKLLDLKLQRRDLLQDLVRRYNSILQDTVISERYGRSVLSVKAGALDQSLGTVHDTSSSGSTIFVEPNTIIPIGNKIIEVKGDITKEENRLLALWSGKVVIHISTINHLSQVMMQLELALVRARYGDWMKGVAPSIHQDIDSPFLIEKFCHPLLLWQQHFEKGRPVVPISFEVSSALRVIAITGPNTGGKTVILKSVGLAVLMARSGFLLPCKGNPSLPWIDQVLADIGDEQSLQQSLSTFSGHITRISRILHSLEISKGSTLVLLDEIGAGTDPTEGTALAISLLKTLADRTRLTVVTTHFGELKALKYSDQRFENASVAFDSQTIKPKYYLQWGIPGRSNALAIASRLGLEPAIIENAQKLIGPNGLEDVNAVIKGLEDQRKLQQSAAEETAALLARTELLHEELLGQWRKQSQKSAEFQEKGRQKLATSIREGQKEVRELIKRLREPGADGEIARSTGKRLRKMQIHYQKETIIKNKNDWFPKVGDRVRLIAINKAAEVLEMSEDGLQVTVLCGLFRSVVDLTSIESLEGAKPRLPEPPSVKIKTNSRVIEHAKVRTKKNTLDVRGLRVHEAQSVIEEKLRHTIGPLWVIHGIGTGKLKKGLLEWLKTLDYVDEISNAPQNEGGAGCTVIWVS